jgi:hypothetical protein
MGAFHDLNTRARIITNHVGADVLICPAERSSAIFENLKTCRASLDWTDEDICPYVVRGGDSCLDLAGGRVFGWLRFFGRRFSAGLFQVGVEFVEFCHGEF